MVGRGVDEPYCTHLTEGHNPLLLETERESTGRKRGGNKRHNDRRQDARQDKALDTGERHACKSQEAEVAASEVRLTDRSTGNIFKGASNPTHRFRGFKEVVTKENVTGVRKVILTK